MGFWGTTHSRPGDLERDEEGLAERISSTPEDLQDGLRQLTLFAPPKSAVEEALARLDPERLTPIEALVKLKELKERL